MLIMVHYIENENLKVGVKEHGAELCSLYSKKADIEYLWQGDSSVWAGQSPILFPIVGRLMDDKYSLGGQEFTLQKHGFARTMDWRFADKDGNSLKFILTDTEKTKESYPFSFDLSVTFTLSGKTLSVSHDILNTNSNTMYFSIGAHPGFNCQMGDILEFECKEIAAVEKIDLESALLLPEKFPILENEREIIITEDIFNEDALIFSNLKSSSMTLKSNAHNHRVTVTFGGAPYLGIWAKPGASYVCIEPWFGVNDSQNKVNDFSEKYQIVHLPAGESFNFTWSATVSE